MRVHSPKLYLSASQWNRCQLHTNTNLQRGSTTTKGFMKAVGAKFSASVFCQDVWTIAGEATADRRAFVVVCSCKYEYNDAAGVLSTDGTFRSSRPFDLCKLRQACAQRGASVHESRVRATSTLSTPILRATISLVEYEGACFCPLGRPFRQDVSSDTSGQVQPTHIQPSVYDSSCQCWAAAWLRRIQALRCSRVQSRHDINAAPRFTTGARGQHFGRARVCEPMRRLRGFSWRSGGRL